MSVMVSQTKNGERRRQWLTAIEAPCGCTEWRTVDDGGLRGEGPRCAIHRLEGEWMDLFVGSVPTESATP